MGTIPTPPTFAAGDTTGVAAKLNQLRDAVNFWALPPRASVYQTATTSIVTGTNVLIGFDTEVYDTDGMHDTVTNNSRIVVQTAGKYEISGQIFFGSNATGARVCTIRKNSAGSGAGGTPLASTQVAAVSGISTSVVVPTVEYAFVVGDYIEMFGNQTSGVTLNTIGGQGITFLRMKLTGS